jgi:hypothetical protein
MVDICIERGEGDEYHLGEDYEENINIYDEAIRVGIS